MLFRCRWCERGFCEDCLDWQKTEILGDNLKEYEMLKFPAIDQAWYIKCPRCIEDHEQSPEAFDLCNGEAKRIDREHQKMIEERVAVEEESRKILAIPSRDESLTDATTINSSGITTPRINNLEDQHSSGRGRAQKGARKSLVTVLVPAETTPERRKRDAAPKSFSSSFELSNLDLGEDSDYSARSSGRRRKADNTISLTPQKTSKANVVNSTTPRKRSSRLSK